ncbi:hypothetical protein [Scytonema sp. PRP1]|uniref:hypothetical protein n=1 Tax=Scytonema sp. PRP1 TaxID=3120513 RepID=UPI00300C0B9B
MALHICRMNFVFLWDGHLARPLNFLGSRMPTPQQSSLQFFGQAAGCLPHNNHPFNFLGRQQDAYPTTIIPSIFWAGRMPTPQEL